MTYLSAGDSDCPHLKAGRPARWPGFEVSQPSLLPSSPRISKPNTCLFLFLPRAIVVIVGTWARRNLESWWREWVGKTEKETKKQGLTILLLHWSSI